MTILIFSTAVCEISHIQCPGALWEVLLNNIKGLINRSVALLQPRACNLFRFEALNVVQAQRVHVRVLHWKCVGSVNDRWFCFSALSSRLQPHGSVARFLYISHQEKDGAGQGFDRRDARETDTYMCCSSVQKGAGIFTAEFDFSCFRGSKIMCCLF